MKLNLTPNEVIGYRIQPDWHSFNVVLVKRHGLASKNAGQEYATTMAYCKNIAFAVTWILNHSLRVEGDLSQTATENRTGSVADVTALLAAYEKAEGHALSAVAELQQRIDKLALTQSALVQSLSAGPDRLQVLPAS